MADAQEPACSVGTGQVQLEGTNFGHQFCQTAQLVWEKHILSDITLVSKDQVSFAAHSFVLMAHSEWFKDKFLASASTLSRKTEMNVVMSQESGLLKHLLTFMYTNKLSICADDLSRVAEAADDLGMQDLRNACRRAELIDANVTTENCLHLWVTAQHLGDQQIINCVSPAALQNFTEVRHSATFKALNPDHFFKYFKEVVRTTFRPAAEILSACIKWVEADPRSRRDKLCDILNELQLCEIDSWYLEDLLRNDVIKSNPIALQTLKGAIANKTLNTPCRVRQEVKEEKCLIVAGVTKGDCEKASNEVWAIRIEHGFEVTSLGGILATFPAYDYTACFQCCVGAGYLYAVGIGEDRKEVWRFSLEKRTSERCGR